MPEGDAVFRYAIRLRRDLVGHQLEELFVRHRGSLESAVGREVRSIETRGKHTLVHVETSARRPPMALHIHLGMNGSWRRAQRSDRRPGGRDQAGAIAAVAGCEWRCIHPMRSEVLEGDAISSHRSMRNLGPDLLGDNVDWSEIVRRARDPRHARRPIADVLLDQSVASGIGTIYRSETLFVERQSPWAPLLSLEDAKLRSIYQSARRLLSMNLVPGRRTRTTSPDDRRPAMREADANTYVYVRGGEPCLVCGDAVEVRRHSEMARKTYYCRRCQIEEPRQRRVSSAR